MAGRCESTEGAVVGKVTARDAAAVGEGFIVTAGATFALGAVGWRQPNKSVGIRIIPNNWCKRFMF